MNSILTAAVASAAAAFAFAPAASAGGSCGSSCGSMDKAAGSYTLISAEAEQAPSIFELALTNEDPSLKILSTLVAAADLDGALLGDGAFTVFAPTDAAFGELPSGTVGQLLGEHDRTTLKTILTYHVIPARITSDAIPAGETTVETLAGRTLTVTNHDGEISVNGSKVIAADVMASNGVVHVIDGVLLPQGN